MHNLFLGTGKHMLTLWIDRGVLAKQHFDLIQEFVDNVKVPSDIGRIPLKISSGFAGFKADQFKSWINIFSIPSLHQILLPDDLECWRHFVLACRILCKQSLNSADVVKADGLLMHFCERVQRLYGESAITPNMHLHGHLRDVILDYGPVQEFWCFSFERYNGILGKQPTNNRAIEPQLLHQFLFDNLSSSYSFPSEFEENFRSLSLNDFHRSRISGSLLETHAVMPGSSKCAFLLPSKSKRCILQSSDLRVLTKLFAKLHPNSSNIVVNSVYKKYSSIEFNGIAYGSSGNRPSAHPYVVLATWNESYFGPPRSALPDTISHPNSHERPINIHHYVTVAVTYNCISSDKQQCEQWNLAHASWF